jgi:hypothetical protein
MTTTATVKAVAASGPLRIDGLCIRTFLELVEAKYGSIHRFRKSATDPVPSQLGHLGIGVAAAGR